MSKVEDKVIDLTDKMENVLNKYSPEAYEAVLGAIRVDGVNGLLIGLASAITSYFLIRVFMYGYSLQLKDSDDDASFGICFFSATALLFTAGGALIELASARNWVAIFNPELALAKNVIGL